MIPDFDPHFDMGCLKWITISDDKKASKKKEPKFSGMLISGIYIKKVIYNNPCTIIIWSDGTKTTAKCQQGDVYNKEIGLLLAYIKKIYPYDKILRVLEDWVPSDEDKNIITLNDLRKRCKTTYEKD